MALIASVTAQDARSACSNAPHVAQLFTAHSNVSRTVALCHLAGFAHGFFPPTDAKGKTVRKI